MAKQRYNVELNFNANTTEVKQKIQDLQTSLRNIAKLPGAATELFDDTNIKKASDAAMELERHLYKAVNVDTGKLDLSRFSQSLKASGKDLNSYANTLLSLGPIGQQTFFQLASALAAADAPVTRINKKLKDLGKTLINTARWQLSSSILHGFMGAVQQAYGYAQDLNESLNDIRIVTGKDTAAMAQFAKKANDAARALSTTTREYAEASLIYFQQGDSMEEVEAKAAITTKLAQVTGQSMEQVSDQLTAVWNNFYDGSQSLEHYADAMARLGAITASSSDEIAQGLEKFASVANMIGLGFDNAAAALATVTAATRQSADVVGTSFKTIFARIQGLSLGETLDDGTTLNQYSVALAKVGINIKTTTGEIKDMNTILNEMGERWKSLSQDQQTALATTVGGIRQYGQLVALMENFDTYKQNVAEAQMSDGAVANQAAIYAESWEAARDRVRAAMEGVYDSLINDEFFIDLLNGLEKVIIGVKGLVDNLGGLGGIVQMISGILMATFANRAPEAISHLTANIRTLTGQAEKDTQKMRDDFEKQLEAIKSDSNLSEAQKIEIEGLIKVNKMKKEEELLSKSLTKTEEEEYEARIRNVQAMYESAAALAKKKEEAESSLQSTKQIMQKNAGGKITNVVTSYNKVIDDKAQTEEKISVLDKGPTTESSLKELEKAQEMLQKTQNKAVETETALQKMAAAYGLSDDEISQIILNEGKLNPDVYTKISDNVQKVVDKYSDLSTRQFVLEDFDVSIQSQEKAWTSYAEAINTEAEKMGNSTKAQELIIKKAEEMRNKMMDYLDAVTKVANDKGLDSVGKQAQKAKKRISEMKNAMLIDKKTNKLKPDMLINLKDWKNVSKEVVSSARNIDNQIERTEAQLQDMDFSQDEIKELGDNAAKSAKKTTELFNAMANTDKQTSALPEHTVKLSEALASVGGAAMITMAAINSITNAFKTLTDPDTSGTEKITAGIGAITTALAALNAVTAVGTTLKNMDSAAESKNIVVKAAHAISSKIAAAASVASAVAKTGETSAVWANTLAWLSNPIMWIAAIIMAVIAAFVALIAVIKAVSDALNNVDDKKRLEDARKEAAEMSTALDDAKKAADELRESIDKYDSAIDKMKNLAEGTEEFQQAMEEANEEARKLILSSDFLKDKYSFNAETGLIEFEKGALEGAQKAANQGVIQAQNNKTIADNRVLASQNALLATETTGSMSRGDASLTSFLSGLAQAFLVDPAAMPRTLLSGTIENETAILQDKALNKLAEAYLSSGNNLTAALGSLSSADQDLIKKLGLNESELSKLTSEMAANSKLTRENNKELAYNNLKDKAAFQNSKNQNFLAELAGYDIDKRTKELYESTYKDKAFGKTDKDIQKQYAATMGYEWVSDDNNNQGTYRVKEGDTWVERTISDEQVRMYLAQQKAIEESVNGLKDQAKVVDDLENKEQELAQQVANGTLTYEQYQEQLTDYGKKLKLGEKDLDNYLNNYGSENIKTERKLRNIEASAEKKWGLSKDEAKEKIRKFAKDTTDFDVDIGLNVAATSNSLEEFQKRYKMAVTQAHVDALKATSSQLADILKSSIETSSFSREDIERLSTDKDFKKYLEEQGSTWEEFVTKSFTEKYNIISGFRQNLNAQVTKELPGQIENAQSNLDDYEAVQEILNKTDQLGEELKRTGNTIDIRAQAEQLRQKIEGLTDAQQAILKNAVEDREGFDATIASRKAEVQELKGQDYDLKVGWSDVDLTLGGMKVLSSWLSTVEKDADFDLDKDSYILTPAQARQAYETYPELMTKEGAVEKLEGGRVAIKKTALEDFKRSQSDSFKTNIDKAIKTEETNLERAKTNGDQALAQTIQSRINFYRAILEQGILNYGKTDSFEPIELLEKTADRYHELNRIINNTKTTIDNLETAQSHAFGKDKVRLINKEIDEVKKLGDKYQELQDKQNEELKVKANNLSDLFAGAKDVEFDANTGEITNYLALYEAAEEELRGAQQEVNDTEGSAEANKKLEKAQEIYDKRMKAFADYEQLLDDANQTSQDILDNFYKLRDLNFTNLNTALEKSLETEAEALEIIDYYLNATEDDFYRIAEGANLTSQKIQAATSSIAKQQLYMARLQSGYDTVDANGNRNISDAEYEEGIKNTISSIREQITTIRELDKAMLDYYGNTLTRAQEEIDKYISRTAHLSSVLDHYQSIMAIMGKEKNYKQMGVILQGVADNASSLLQAAQSTYQMQQDAADAAKSKLDEVRKKGIVEEIEFWEKSWKDAQAAADSAQEDMLSKTEEWAEAMKAVLENNLSDFAATLEDSLTGGSSFDEMNTAFERAASLQEEYLTVTNQVYETTKMMRTAQKALDEATSAASKNKLKGFIDQTKQLQNQSQLSKYELDTQQAKYDLLVAQIALEDAQNAKSVVRLQRDAEGNFGYVYTADENKVADAQQKVDDAENALYNKALEGTNDYTQKYQQTMAEAYDAVTALTQAWQDGQIASEEEYSQKMQETIEYYQQKLLSYNQLYQVAVSTNTNAFSEGWSSTFSSITGQTQLWIDEMKTYADKTKGAFSSWGGVVSTLENTVGNNVTSITTNVEKITSATAGLVAELTKNGGLIDGLEEVISQMQTVVSTYASTQRKINLNTIETSESYVNNLIKQRENDLGLLADASLIDIAHELPDVANAAKTLSDSLTPAKIIEAIDLYAKSRQFPTSEPRPNKGPSVEKTEQISQTIYIEADFPAVESVANIKEAFSLISNKAVQRAYGEKYNVLY